MFCTRCGAVIQEGNKFCTKCGLPLDYMEEADGGDAGAVPSTPPVVDEKERVVPRSENIEGTARKWDKKNAEKRPFPKAAVIIPIAIVGICAIAAAVFFLLPRGRNSETAALSEPSNAEIESMLPDTEDASDSLDETSIESGSDDTDEIVSDYAIEVRDEITKADTRDGSSETSADDALDEDAAGVPEKVNVEEEVLRIRGIYNTIQEDCDGYDKTSYDWGTFYDGGEYKKTIIKSGTYGVDYERWYFYEDSDLLFAFYFKGTDEQRFYFYKNRMFRWIDNDTVHDEEYGLTEWRDWEDAILEESNAANTGSAAVSMAGLQYVLASSTLNEGGQDHSPENLCDGNLNTAWVEGSSGDGIGQFVEYIFDTDAMFSGISIANGYQKSDDLYGKNGRVRSLRVQDDRGNEFVIDVSDISGVQDIDFEEPFVTDSVKVFIESVYPGNKYEDICISEMKFY